MKDRALTCWLFLMDVNDVHMHIFIIILNILIDQVIRLQEQIDNEMVKFNDLHNKAQGFIHTTNNFFASESC